MLYRAVAADGKFTWENLGDGGDWPNDADRQDYHYEYLPIIYDAKRERLVHLMGRDSSVYGLRGWHLSKLGVFDLYVRVSDNGLCGTARTAIRCSCCPPFKVLKSGENPPLDACDNVVIGPESQLRKTTWLKAFPKAK